LDELDQLEQFLLPVGVVQVVVENGELIEGAPKRALF